VCVCVCVCVCVLYNNVTLITTTFKLVNAVLCGSSEDY